MTMSDFTLSVLVVDDDASIRDVCTHMISSLGHKVDQAADGVEGWLKLAKNKYDLILTDMNMPGMTGSELLAEIKRELPNTEVVMMTGYGSIEDAVNTMKMGAADFILKPIEMKQIVSLLHRTCGVVKARLENSELKLLNQKLKALNDAKSKFLALTSHELRTPLFVLHGNLQRLKKIMKLESEGNNGTMLQRAEKACSDLIRVVERICTLSALETGTVKVHVSKYQLTEILQDPVKQARRYAAKRGQEIHLESFADDNPIECDRELIRQAIKEVLMNAVKYTPDEGHIWVKASRGTVEGRPIQSILIEDSGIGIPQEELEQIFQPFYESGDIQYHSTSKFRFRGGGMGIGLAMVDRIVKSHHGWIDVTSPEGKGTTVRIDLPELQSTIENYGAVSCMETAAT
ncbi:response regulator [Acidobacteriota bacterium]